MDEAEKADFQATANYWFHNILLRPSQSANETKITFLNKQISVLKGSITLVRGKQSGGFGMRPNKSFVDICDRKRTVLKWISTRPSSTKSPLCPTPRISLHPYSGLPELQIDCGWVQKAPKTYGTTKGCSGIFGRKVVNMVETKVRVCCIKFLTFALRL